jgi:hypothetical protein
MLIFRDKFRKKRELVLWHWGLAQRIFVRLLSYVRLPFSVIALTARGLYVRGWEASLGREDATVGLGTVSGAVSGWPG